MGTPLQKIPAKNKLSYLWACAVGEDRLYSHVFAENKVQPVYAEPSGHGGISFYQTVHYFHWLEARPFNGQKDQFVVNLCAYTRNSASAVSGDRRISESALKFIEGGRSVFTRDEAKSIIANQERAWARSGLLPLKSQPFNGFITTALTPAPKLV